MASRKNMKERVHQRRLRAFKRFKTLDLENFLASRPAGATQEDWFAYNERQAQAYNNLNHKLFG